MFLFQIKFYPVVTLLWWSYREETARRLRSVTRANNHSACYPCLAWLVCHGPFYLTSLTGKNPVILTYITLSWREMFISLANLNAFLRAHLSRGKLSSRLHGFVLNFGDDLV